MRITNRGGKRYVLFDETNSLVEYDTQEEEFELGLVRKDVSLTQSSTVDKGKAPEGEPNLGTDNLEGGREQTSQGEALLNLNRIGPVNPIIPELIWEQVLE